MSDYVNPPQAQGRQPGVEHQMDPAPRSSAEGRAGAGRLRDRRLLITGGDSGIGRAVAVLAAREGADVMIGYLDEHDDAKATAEMVEAEGRRARTVAGDIADEAVARRLVRETVDELGGLDVLVNNAAEQHVADDLTKISAEQLERTFRTNVFGMFHVTKAALEHLPDRATIVNSTSVVAYQGNPMLIDYSMTKGAIVSFTRSMAQSLAGRRIRVNAVAPGPVWTPLIPASFPAEAVASFGGDTIEQRPAEPEEIAPSYIFLASADSAFISGQVLHPNGGQPVGS